ncbi:hypothetical protein [Paractinoplanes rishiriensis]|uniref:Uncharacterized protein n=1 Tax=Paractinoplanes rishiriensis TaxID=1050105 RepID=A0A919KDF0_9ACTN|nr:hypothetical protein [Actinoplanes rishiriensis]GIF02372.1 hypothetical protein Ari01nite_98360 [Actinoplanes rishiriensis]
MSRIPGLTILGLELRRSAAFGTALILLVVGVLALFFAEGIGFATGWVQLAMTQRLYLALLWPLALAAGAWQGSRERRSKVTELFASTPRPRVHRTVPTLGAMAVAVVGGYLAMGIAGGLWIAGTAEYLPVTVVVVTAVGALALVAAVWLGLAVGRLLPWLVTAPALAVAGLGLLLSIPGATRPRGWLALVFSPIYEMNMPDAYATVPGRVSAAQAVWLVALAGTAVLLFASGGWRIRLAALLPVVAGAGLAIAVMPHQNRVVTDAVDPVARQLVCEGVVCVSRVHEGLLPEVAGPAREGLAILAKLPGGPVRVHEDTTTYGPMDYPPWRTDVVLLHVGAGTDGHLADRSEVLTEVVAGAFASPPECEDFAGSADLTAAAHWLIGGTDPPREADAAAVWDRLRQLPAGEAQSRVVALRQAALNCSAGDGLFPRSAG